MGGLSNGPVPYRRPHPLAPNQWVEKYPFKISANRLKIDENVNRAHLKTHWLAVKRYNEKSYNFSPKPQMGERRSSTVGLRRLRVVIERFDHQCGDDLARTLPLEDTSSYISDAVSRE